MKRFGVVEMTVYGRKVFLVTDRHESMTVVRADSPGVAELVAGLLEEYAKSHPNPYAEAV